MSCKIVKHNPPTDADKAFLAADYEKAASLYQVALTSQPGDADAMVGLVHALLHEEKLQQAAEAVQSALTSAPNSATLLTLRGEVELRRGEPWRAAESVSQAGKLDPCNPRTMLLFADISRLNSLYASARRGVITAHLVDPEDPEIRAEWISTLPLHQKIAEVQAYLAEPRGDDADELRHWHLYLDQLKKMEIEPHKPCSLATPMESTEIPFTKLMYDATRVRAFGLEVKLNNRSARLEIDTGAGGLVVSHSVAQRLGLKAFSQTEMGGIGDEGNNPAYTAYADSIHIGNLEFRDCAVRVLDSRHGLNNVDGLIGMDVFSHFLVTLDYPMRKLVLSPLPPRPGEEAGAAPALKTNETDDTEPDNAGVPSGTRSAQSDASANGATGGANAPPAVASTVAKLASHGPYDRYIAPEMKDYTPVFRRGHDLLLPAALNGDKLKLFIMDTGAWATTISPDAAREVTKLHQDSRFEVRGLSGKVEKIYTANEITFSFAHLSQKAYDVVSFDTSKVSKNLGIEISGFIGAKTLEQLTIHIDYRDGLVKFDYDPNRGYRN